MTSKKQLNKYIIVGGSFFQKEKVKEIVKDIDESNIRSFFADELDKEEFFEYLYSFPLFGDKNIAILRDAEKIKDKDLIPSLINVTENIVIILFNSDKPKEDEFKKYKDHFNLILELKKAVTPQLIQEMFEQDGFKISFDTAKYILDVANRDINVIQNEIDKIKIYFNYNKPKNDEELISIISFSKNESIYDFLKVFFSRDATRSLNLLNEIIKGGENIERIFYELSRHIISMFLYSISPGLVNEYTYTIHNYKDFLSRWDKDEIAEIISILTEVDYHVKTGREEYLQGMYRLIAFACKIF